MNCVVSTTTIYSNRCTYTTGILNYVLLYRCYFSKWRIIIIIWMHANLYDSRVAHKNMFYRVCLFILFYYFSWGFRQLYTRAVTVDDHNALECVFPRGRQTERITWKHYNILSAVLLYLHHALHYNNVAGTTKWLLYAAEKKMFKTSA